MQGNEFNILNQIYQQSPQSFTDDEVYSLEQISQEYSLPFKRNQDAGDFNLFKTIGQTIDGFIEGFTTIDTPLVDQPRNTVEGIARSIGHLLGFIGVIPGLRSVGSLTAKAIGKAAGFTKLTRYGNQISKAQNLTMKMKSFPMMISDAAMKCAGGNRAVKVASGFLQKQGLSHSMTRHASDIMEGALHLGIASSVSSWRQGTDEMMNSFTRIQLEVHSGDWEHYCQARSHQTYQVRDFGYAQKPGEDPKGLARIFSASIYQGLPSTMDEEPLELKYTTICWELTSERLKCPGIRERQLR